MAAAEAPAEEAAAVPEWEAAAEEDKCIVLVAAFSDYLKMPCSIEERKLCFYEEKERHIGTGGTACVYADRLRHGKDQRGYY